MIKFIIISGDVGNREVVRKLGYYCEPQLFLIFPLNVLNYDRRPILDIVSQQLQKLI